MRSAECGVRSAECGVRIGDCGVRSAEWGVWIFDAPSAACQTVRAMKRGSRTARKLTRLRWTCQRVTASTAAANTPIRREKSARPAAAVAATVSSPTKEAGSRSANGLLPSTPTARVTR